MEAHDRRPPLTRERIVQAALELADEAGVDAVTMRRVGGRLGYEAMSLYRHVANKDDLLDGMLDRVLAEWELPAAGPTWPDGIRTTARSVYEALRRHPWSARVLMTAPRLRPVRLRYMESLLASLREAGFGAVETYSLYHLLDGYIFGFALWEIAYTTANVDEGQVAELMRQIPWDELPRLAEHAAQHSTEGPHRDVSAFDVGLDLILEGLQKRLRPAAE